MELVLKEGEEKLHIRMIYVVVFWWILLALLIYITLLKAQPKLNCGYILFEATVMSKEFYVISWRNLWFVEMHWGRTCYLIYNLAGFSTKSLINKSKCNACKEFLNSEKIKSDFIDLKEFKDSLKIKDIKGEKGFNKKCISTIT